MVMRNVVLLWMLKYPLNIFLCKAIWDAAHDGSIGTVPWLKIWCKGKKKWVWNKEINKRLPVLPLLGVIGWCTFCSFFKINKLMNYSYLCIYLGCHQTPPPLQNVKQSRSWADGDAVDCRCCALECCVLTLDTTRVCSFRTEVRNRLWHHCLLPNTMTFSPTRTHFSSSHFSMCYGSVPGCLVCVCEVQSWVKVVRVCVEC